MSSLPYPAVCTTTSLPFLSLYPPLLPGSKEALGTLLRANIHHALLYAALRFTKADGVAMCAAFSRAGLRPEMSMIRGEAQQALEQTFQCLGNSLHQKESKEANILAALVGVAIDSVGAYVGAQCSPITVIGLSSGASCGSQPVCCSNNSFNGVVAIGCSPINVNL
ncbi:hypothetical protein NLJ89_g351 [Agrocybe chaxingu]|uniref:Hydrophobin n=1 Tax=Agrocybe chaxingu TaxID=84603 RepID=A0A9W8TGL3_9AGAR|nr:hypothetical protein NLJ89_g351 [Agrocybe chaxingu]